MESVEEYVKDKWQLLTAFSAKEELKTHLWNDLIYRYTEAHRYYHNLNHVGYIFSLCDKYFDQIQNPVITGFAILYNNVVYDTYRNDNEEQSAALAEAHLLRLRLNQSIINQIKDFILATKDHQISDHITHKDDLALFLDFDTAILAEKPDVYNLYREKIRKEYAKYPNDIYQEGRKQALSKMLDNSLFHTTLFKGLMEEKAVRNIRGEIGGV